jgi:very-short-patch-repair endonuclease
MKINLKENPPRPAAIPPAEGIRVTESPPAEGCRNGGVGSPVLKYESNLTPFAKKLRSGMTLAEVLLWKKLNRRQLGVRFNRQKPIGKWVVDFYCKELQLAVEVDGGSHNFKKQDDDKRQQQLESLGIRFLRFWDCEIKNEIGSVVERIEMWIRENPPRPAATPPVEGIRGEPFPGCGRPSDGGDWEKTSCKTIPSSGGVPERRGGSKRGSALVVVLWILMIIALIVSTFAFEMQLESKIITLQRKRFKADQLALAGIEMAKAMLAFKEEKNTTGGKTVSEDPYLNEVSKITNGIPVNFEEKLGDGTVRLRIDFEEGRRNIKKLNPEEWKVLFEQAGIPNTLWDGMLDCLADWQDENDLHQLNGAESDDSFYKKRGYECKNAAVDTVDELLLIKNWDEEVLYGTPPGKKTDEPIIGIANQLTTWGDGKINPNSASTNVLNSLSISDSMINAILELRNGPDGTAGTADDGIAQADLTALGRDDIFTLKPEYVKVKSIGDVGGVQSEISCIFKLGEKAAVPLFWLEGKTSE